MTAEATELVPMARTRTRTIAREALKAAACAIPWVGGPIGSVLSAFSIAEVQARLDALLRSIEERLGNRIYRLESDPIAQEHFLRLLAETRFVGDAEELARLRSAAVNVALGGVEDGWHELLHECVARLDTTDVVVLKAVYDIPAPHIEFR